MSEPLATSMGAFRKLAWGNNHTNRLAASIRAFNEAHPTRPAANLKRAAGEDNMFVIEWRLHDVFTPDSNWPLMVGDALNCYRSALDHIVSEHLRIEQGLKPEQIAEHRFQFPICDTAGKFADETRKLKRFASESFLTDLRQTQRFTFDLDSDGEFLLTMLRDLNNLDKHRGLALTESFVRVEEGTFTFDPSLPLISFTSHEVPAREGELLATVKFRGPITYDLTSIRFRTVRSETIYVPGIEDPIDISQILPNISTEISALVGVFFAHPGEHKPVKESACKHYHQGKWCPDHP